MTNSTTTSWTRRSTSTSTTCARRAWPAVTHVPTHGGLVNPAEEIHPRPARTAVLDLPAATWTAPDRYEIRPDARRFENWETNYAGKIGLGVAVGYALCWGLEAIEARVTVLADRLRAQLTNVDGVQVHDQGLRRCGIVTFTVEGFGAQQVRQRLHEHGVNVSVSPVEYARFDLPGRGLPDLVRASVHCYNTDDELDLLDARGQTEKVSSPAGGGGVQLPR